MKFKTKALSNYTAVDPYYYQYGACKYSTSIYEKDFDTFEDAVAAAKKTAEKTKEDVEVWAVKATVKFPLPTFEVVMADDSSK